jgi:ketosteroid isomerase-like protein
VTVEEEVRAFNDAYERGLVEQDVDALVSLHTEHARLMFAGQPVIQGRTAIEKVLTGWLEQEPVSIRFETEEVLAGGDLVVDIGQTIAAGGRSKYVVVHRRQPDGSLRIAIDAPTSDGPQAGDTPEPLANGGRLF